MAAVSDAVVARACLAAAGRLRGVRCVRLAPEALARRLAAAPPLVGFETLPDPFGVVGAVVAPTLVCFAACPAVATRAAAGGAWRDAARRQSAWTEYAFGKTPLFDATRPLVLAAPADGDAAYLDHAAALGGAPFVCLADGAAVDALAAFAGADVLPPAADADVTPEAAAAASAATLDVINLHGDFCQAVRADRAVAARRALAVAAAAATPDVVRALDGLAASLAAAAADGDLDAAVAAALDGDRALLEAAGRRRPDADARPGVGRRARGRPDRARRGERATRDFSRTQAAVFDCALDGLAVPLAPRGTTLGAAPTAPPPPPPRGG